MNNAAPAQLTFRAVVLAIVLAVVLSAANAYLGLFAGLTIATAIPAAVGGDRAQCIVFKFQQGDSAATKFIADAGNQTLQA